MALGVFLLLCSCNKIIVGFQSQAGDFLESSNPFFLNAELFLWVIAKGQIQGYLIQGTLTSNFSSQSSSQFQVAFDQTCGAMHMQELHCKSRSTDLSILFLSILLLFLYLFLSILLLFLCLSPFFPTGFWDRVFRYSPGSPVIQYAHQADLKLRDTPASVS